MSKDNRVERRSSVTTVTRGADVERETSLQALTPQEEKVLRMAYGMSEDDSRALQFGLGADEETRLRLAMIEGQLLRCLESPQEMGEGRRPSPAELLSAWLDQE